MEKLKIIPPIKESTEDFEEIERRILDIFRREIYLPLLAELKDFAPDGTFLENSQWSLVRALMDGQVTFHRGRFKGKFDSRVSREIKSLGGEYDRKTKSWRLASSKLPPDVDHAIRISDARFQEAAKRVTARIQKIVPAEVADLIKIQDCFDSTLWKVEDAMDKSMKNIRVLPKLSARERDQIATEYTTNLTKYIKDFTEKEIVELREKIERNVMKGNRYERMISTIRKSYGVSQNKAKFLARQETGLMMAQFKSARYQAADVNEYIWTCVLGSPNHPVRPMHKDLDGKIFRFDKPPITAEDGRRNNPGEDYNCRCMARPIVRF